MTRINGLKNFAFTLIELLVVVAIISLLSSVVLSSLSGTQESARGAYRQQEIGQLQTALEIYYTKNGDYPSGRGRCGHPNASYRMENELQPLVDAGAISQIPCDESGVDHSEEGGTYHYFSPGSSVWWGGNNEYCGTTRNSEMDYMLLWLPEKETDAIRFSADGPTNINRCGDGAYCCAFQ